jgi:uncharacterized protein YdaL
MPGLPGIFTVKIKLLFATTALLFSACLQCAIASQAPCDDVDRDFTVADSMSLAGPVSAQLELPGTKPEQSFKFESWTVLYAKSKKTDGLFLFYNKDPLTQKYIAKWSDVSKAESPQKIANWVKKNVPGIPDPLASCFIWHVTQELKTLPPAPECDCKK